MRGQPRSGPIRNSFRRPGMYSRGTTPGSAGYPYVSAAGGADGGGELVVGLPAGAGGGQDDLLRADGLVRAELLGGSLRVGVEPGPDHGGGERWTPALVREPAQLAQPGGDGLGGQPDGQPAVTEGRGAAKRRPR